MRINEPSSKVGYARACAVLAVLLHIRKARAPRLENGLEDFSRVHLNSRPTHVQ